MSGRPWDAFLTEQDRAALAAAPRRGRCGFGERAAVLSVDNYRCAVGDRPEPLLKSIKTWPRSTGLAGWEALERIASLFAAARVARIPIIHITSLGEEECGVADFNRKADKAIKPVLVGEAEERFLRRHDFSEQAAPLPGEVVLKKSAPSAFFGTPLIGHLVREGIDTLIVCGETTSGCVRATVVDGCSYRLRMIVVEECVYDKCEASSALSLFDIDQKYGDVLSLTEVVAWVDQSQVPAHAHSV